MKKAILVGFVCCVTTACMAFMFAFSYFISQSEPLGNRSASTVPANFDPLLMAHVNGDSGMSEFEDPVQAHYLNQEKLKTVISFTDEQVRRDIAEYNLLYGTEEVLPVARWVPGSSKRSVFSPYYPESHITYVDVRGFKSGQMVWCPYAQKMFKVPPQIPLKPKIETKDKSNQSKKHTSVR